MMHSHVAPLLVALAAFGLAPSAHPSRLGGRSGPAPTLEVRNRGVLGVNVELVAGPGVHFQTMFLGRVDAGNSRVFEIRGATMGDSVWVRAKPIDGSAAFEQRDVVLRPGVVWEVPPRPAERPAPS